MRDGQTTRRKVQECTSSVCAVLGKNATEESKIFKALAQSDTYNPVLVNVFSELASRVKQLTDSINNEKNSKEDQLSNCEHFYVRRK
jgi:thioredoxin-like negative regulator of GroEL